MKNNMDIDTLNQLIKNCKQEIKIREEKRDEDLIPDTDRYIAFTKQINNFEFMIKRLKYEIILIKMK